MRDERDERDDRIITRDSLPERRGMNQPTARRESQYDE